jgi:hypothetical protein
MAMVAEVNNMELIHISRLERKKKKIFKNMKTNNKINNKVFLTFKPRILKN